MNPLIEAHNTAYSRRQFFRKSGTGLGMAALASLLGPRGIAAAGKLAGMAPPQVIIHFLMFDS